MNIWTVFLTGLFTGGLTCLAVQGGLLAATLSQKQSDNLANKTKQSGNSLPILSFLTAKITAYTILGFFLGSLGSIFQLSPITSGILQILIALFMIGTALNLLKAHPLFRYFVIQPPKFLARLVKNQAKSKNLFAPLLLGSLTVFIPCGTTQAMMALAIGSGNAILGALILFVFTLGTSPLFFILGYLTTRLTDALHRKFLKLTAFIIIVLSFFNLNNALSLTGTKYTFDNIFRNFWCTLSFCDNVQANNIKGVASSRIDLYLEKYGYSPQELNIPKKSGITLNLINNTGSGCIQAFTIPKLGVQKIVRVGTSETISFQSPGKPQDLYFMCGMGMYKGVMHVI